jgi:hypothetical protein
VAAQLFFLSGHLFVVVVVDGASIASSATAPWWQLKTLRNNEMKQSLLVDSIGIYDYRHSYNDDDDDVSTSKSNVLDSKNVSTFFRFDTFDSPHKVENEVLSKVRNPTKHWTNYYSKKDGRYGNVSTTKLDTEGWVLAESQQIALNCTTQDVLRAYLSGHLQQKWNSNQVIKCTITKKYDTSFVSSTKNNHLKEEGHTHYPKPGWFLSTKKSLLSNDQRLHPSTGYYYQQDLVLKSQRVLTSHTGIMKYSQRIQINRILVGNNGGQDYTVSVRLLPPPSTTTDTTTTTRLKPFESLEVYVGLQQRGPDVTIYAAGIMQVNRNVVPNLVVFDASGIAGSMAGKGTLWLAAYFKEKTKKKRRETDF